MDYQFLQLALELHFLEHLIYQNLTNLSVAEVAKELAEELRTPSPSIEISGNSLANVPEDGSSFRINHDGLTYTLTMKMVK